MSIEYVDLAYGNLFSELFKNSILKFIDSNWLRNRNKSAPFSFGENHLREFIRNSRVDRSIRFSDSWLYLEIEKGVNGDLVERGRKHGGIDYFLTDKYSKDGYNLKKPTSFRSEISCANEDPDAAELT